MTVNRCIRCGVNPALLTDNSREHEFYEYVCPGCGQTAVGEDGDLPAAAERWNSANPDPAAGWEKKKGGR